MDYYERMQAVTTAPPKRKTRSPLQEFEGTRKVLISRKNAEGEKSHQNLAQKEERPRSTIEGRKREKVTLINMKTCIQIDFFRQME